MVRLARKHLDSAMVIVLDSIAADHDFDLPMGSKDYY
jgi:hypothetical protein